MKVKNYGNRTLVACRCIVGGVDSGVRVSADYQMGLCGGRRIPGSDSEGVSATGRVSQSAEVSKFTGRGRKLDLLA